MGSQNVCLGLHHSSLCCLFLSPSVYHFFIFAPSLKADAQAHMQRSPLGTGGTGKQTALLCVGLLEFTVTASLFKHWTFIMSWRLESALYLILTPLPFSPSLKGGMPHSLELSWLTRISTQQQEHQPPAPLYTNFPQHMHFVLLLLFGSLLFTEHTVSKVTKNTNFSLRPINKAVDVNYVSKTSVNTLQTQNRALVSLWAWRERKNFSADTETTPAGNHLSGALEKLIRLLILAAVWVRWSHKGIHILRIKQGEWQSAQMLHKNLYGPKLHAGGCQSRSTTGEDGVTDEGVISVWNPLI